MESGRLNSRRLLVRQRLGNRRPPVVVISGPIANKPGNGGIAWVPLSYLHGFSQLGFQTYFIEGIATEQIRDASGAPCDVMDSVNLAHFRQVVGEGGLQGRAALVELGSGDGGSIAARSVFGPPLDELRRLAERAQLLVNLSGHLA